MRRFNDQPANQINTVGAAHTRRLTTLMLENKPTPKLPGGSDFSSIFSALPSTKICLNDIFSFKNQGA